MNLQQRLVICEGHELAEAHILGHVRQPEGCPRLGWELVLNLLVSSPHFIQVCCAKCSLAPEPFHGHRTFVPCNVAIGEIETDFVGVRVEVLQEYDALEHGPQQLLRPEALRVSAKNENFVKVIKALSANQEEKSICRGRIMKSAEECRS